MQQRAKDTLKIQNLLVRLGCRLCVRASFQGDVFRSVRESISPEKHGSLFPQPDSVALIFFTFSSNRQNKEVHMNSVFCDEDPRHSFRGSSLS
jgi:hypothetical protein